MMAVLPIYQGDLIVMELEQEQKLRDRIERRRLELMAENRKIEAKLTQSGEINGGDSTRDRDSRRDN